MRGKAAPSGEPAGGGLRPWHLLLVGGLASMVAGAVVSGGTGSANTILVVLAIGAAALVAAGVYGTVAPFAGSTGGEQVEMLGGRTRAALEREKMLVLRSIKEVEFDRAMRKISEVDFQEMSGRLRRRAAGLMRQLDGEAGYRALVERDLAAMLGRPAPAPAPPAVAAPEPACPQCGTVNDRDARFCKACGTPLTGRAS